MTVVASASGTRIDCDSCGEHVASHELALPQLRRATGYVRINGRDYCPQCARGASQRRFASRFTRPS